MTTAQISSCIFLGTVIIISCFAISKYDFHDENPIKLVTDGLEDMRRLILSAMDDNLVDDLSHARLNRHSIKAIYQFGDSLSDTGNYIWQDPYSSFGQFPYGESYFDKPTGRCSDGLLMIDYIAKYLKLPFLDPYLNKDGNFTHGVNFAVIGATALNASTLAAKDITSSVTNHSLSVQLGWFKSHINSVYPNASVARRKLSKALFMVGEIGGNDYNFAISGGKPQEVTYQLVTEVVQIISAVVEELIHLGATRIAIPGNLPMGCMTVYLTWYKSNDSATYDELKCIKGLNEFSLFHNRKLKEAIKNLRKEHPCIEIAYMDLDKALKRIFRNATAFGFDKNEMYKACCGTGDKDYNFGGDFCGVPGVPVCERPKRHINWDGYHLTGHAYRVMSKWLIRRTFGFDGPDSLLCTHGEYLDTRAQDGFQRWLHKSVEVHIEAETELYRSRLTRRAKRSP